jgi:hypothetical protein
MADVAQHIEHQAQGNDGGYDEHTQDHEGKNGAHRNVSAGLRSDI